MNTITRAGLCLPLALFLFGLLSTPAFAQERLHRIVWEHPEPRTVSYFVVLLSPEGRVEGARETIVGRPPGVPSFGSTRFEAIVAFEPSELLAVSAVGLDGRRSPPSRWLPMPPSQPGRPMLVD